MPGPPILFLPIIEWSFRQQRPQQLARCFSRAGWRVYYPSLALTPSGIAPYLLEGSIWRLGLRGRADFDPYGERMSEADVELAFSSLVAALPAGGLDGLWMIVELPVWRPLAERLREHFRGAILFDCLDDYAAFSEHADLRDEELRLTESADLVVATAEVLHDRLAKTARRLALIPNGCDPEHFAPVVARARPAAGAEVPTIGYFGGIHDWFDTGLVAALADARPRWRFVLAGDTFHCDTAPLRTRSNITLLGEVPYAELPRIASAFDVGLIPFQINALTRATNPVKVYEMLACGLPVVAVDLPELRALAPPVSIATSPADFVEAIERALQEPAAERRRRARFAAEHAWSRRFWDLRQAMDAAKPNLWAPETRSERVGPWKDDGSLAANWLDPCERLNAALAAAAAMRSERDDAATEVRSLVEQRDRVHAEALRLQTELERVEAERLALEVAEQARVARTWRGRVRRWVAR